MLTASQVGPTRLSNQHLASPTLESPNEVVAWMGMVQAQDYLGALWAIGQRTRAATEADIEGALADRSVVRTWPARGTLHFVAAADVRWMVDLMAPRMIARAAGRFRQLELDESTFGRSRELLTKALQGGKQLTRAAMYQVLDSAKISTAGQRGIHVLWRLAHEGLLCFGAREGKQQTFALLDEWVPPTRPLPRDEALAKLARRYFSSHGPATLQDFVWWSGLTTAEASAGIAAATMHLAAETVDGKAYWQASSVVLAKSGRSTAYLLPAFDEYLVGYRDRQAVLELARAKQVNAGGGMLNPSIVVDGQVVGTWKRRLKKDAVVVTPTWFTSPTKAVASAMDRAASRYGAFLGRRAVVDGREGMT